MQLLLGYLFLTVVWGMRSARTGRRVRPLAPLLVAFVVSLGYLSLRFV